LALRLQTIAVDYDVHPLLACAFRHAGLARPLTQVLQRSLDVDRQVALSRFDRLPVGSSDGANRIERVQD
jgi:hypothetical protein